MGAIRLISTAAMMALLALPVAASVAVCDRVTHISHGGSGDHADMGNGKVMWIDWWAQEGVFKDVWLADCSTGTAMSLRTWEERIGTRHVVDRTQRVVDEIARQAEASPAFFTIDRVANEVRRDGVDLMVTSHGDEFCACAQAYPELRGDKAPFEGAL